MHLFSLFLTLAFASAADDVPRARCEANLGHSVEAIVDGRVTFRVAGARGPRGVLTTSYPPVTADTLAHARRQGVFYWGHAVAVEPSLAAARAHDQTVAGTSQVLYAVAPGVGMAGLEDTMEGGTDRARALVADRWREARDGALVYFDEPDFDPAVHEWGALKLGARQVLSKETGAPAPRVARQMTDADVRRIFHADEMLFLDQDPRGPLFYQRGWFFPPWRGITRAARLMSQTARGGLEYDTTKGALKLAEQLDADGWRFVVDHDFDEVLARAADVAHDLGALKPGEPPVANSWLRDPAMYAATRASHARGDTHSFELRDPGGALVDATLVSFGEGQHVMTDTSFTLAEGKRERLAHLKLIGVASTLWLAENGYDAGVDKQVVTGFTAELKTMYEPSRVVLEAIGRPAPPRAGLTRRWRPPAWTTGVDGARNYPHYGRLSTQRTDQ